VNHDVMHRLMTGMGGMMGGDMMGGDMMGGDMMGGGMSAMAWFWAVFAIVLLLLAVAGGIALIRALTRQPTTPSTPPGLPPANPARTELDLRYARGEVDREEYLQRRGDLEADRS
jgi:putative membrane protein